MRWFFYIFTAAEHLFSRIYFGEILFVRLLDAFFLVKIWTLSDALRHMKDAEVPCNCLITACVTYSPVLRDGYNNKDKKKRLCDCYSLVSYISFSVCSCLFPFCVQIFVPASIWVWVCVCERLALLCICVCVCLSMSVHAVPPVAPCCVCVSLSSGGCSNGSCD